MTLERSGDDGDGDGGDAKQERSTDRRAAVLEGAADTRIACSTRSRA